MEGQVRTRKESVGVRGTHHLETAEGVTSQNTERKRLSEEHLQPGNHRGRDKS